MSQIPLLHEDAAGAEAPSERASICHPRPGMAPGAFNALACTHHGVRCVPVPKLRLEGTMVARLSNKASEGFLVGPSKRSTLSMLDPTGGGGLQAVGLAARLPKLRISSHFKSTGPFFGKIFDPALPGE